MLYGKKLEKCKLIVVNGKLRIQAVLEGLESMLKVWMFNNLTAKGFADLFGEDGRWIGRFKKDKIGIPKFYEADEELQFEDLYTEV